MVIIDCRKNDGPINKKQMMKGTENVYWKIQWVYDDQYRFIIYELPPPPTRVSTRCEQVVIDGITHIVSCLTQEEHSLIKEKDNGWDFLNEI
jgi:hypothetical protein